MKRCILVIRLEQLPWIMGLPDGTEVKSAHASATTDSLELVVESDRLHDLNPGDVLPRHTVEWFINV